MDNDSGARRTTPPAAFSFGPAPQGASRLRSRDAPNVPVRKWQDEQVSRFNKRVGEDKDRFAKTFGRVAGRRLTYDELTGRAATE